VAKRLDSKYQPGLRTGAWQKMRVNRGQELVIAGYTPSSKNFDALVIGYFEEGKLMYAARTRNGFTPASRAELFKKLKPLEIKDCPFANLPEKKAGRWGAWLTAEKTEGVPVVETKVGAPIRVRRMDRRQSTCGTRSSSLCGTTKKQRMW
jgi:ATP-dependent DNA ligase